MLWICKPSPQDLQRITLEVFLNEMLQLAVVQLLLRNKSIFYAPFFLSIPKLYTIELNISNVFMLDNGRTNYYTRR